MTGKIKLDLSLNSKCNSGTSVGYMKTCVGYTSFCVAYTENGVTWNEKNKWSLPS